MSSSDANSVVSPFSIFTILSMLSNGDEGDAQKAFLNYLGIDSSVEDVNSFHQTFINAFAERFGKTRFMSSNSLWIKNGFSAHEDFQNILTRYYESEIKSCSSNPAIARDSINLWVKQNTRGLIPELFTDPVTDMAVIVNAIYFKGGWAMEFDKNKTAVKEFRGIDGQSVDVPFMRRKSMIDYYEADNWKSVCLPLGKGNYNMHFILPPSEASFTDISLSRILDIRKNAKTCKVDLSLPKFECGSKVNVNGILEDMGLTGIIKNTYSRIVMNETISDPDILHAGHIKVDEQGVEGAAATALKVGTASGEKPENVTISFDRPFIFVLEEESTHTLLFIGAINRL